VRAQLHVSERRACAALGQHRSTQRKVPRGREDEERLTADIIELAQQYGRYGYRSGFFVHSMVNFIQILFATERMLDSIEGPAQSGRALNLAI
jgi:hypothetical protein